LGHFLSDLGLFEGDNSIDPKNNTSKVSMNKGACDSLIKRKRLGVLISLFPLPVQSPLPPLYYVKDSPSKTL